MVEVDPQRQSVPTTDQMKEIAVPKGDKYKVRTTFCNGVMLDHDHSVLAVATKEYADQLGEALLPTEGHPDKRHVELIELYVFDQEGVQTQFCFTGPFEHVGCEHEMAKA